jgi:predicted esterase
VVAVSATLLEEQLEQQAAADGSSNSSLAEPGTDVLITHGDRDEVVPQALVER